MEFKFKKEYPLNKRKEQSYIILINNPKKVPIILEKDPNSKIEPIQKCKFLIQENFTVNHFSRMIYAQMPTSDTESLFFSVKGKYAISGDRTMGDIYKEYKDKEDGFLYIAYSTTQVFG